jgi:hypothetical protein
LVDDLCYLHFRPEVSNRLIVRAEATCHGWITLEPSRDLNCLLARQISKLLTLVKPNVY